jgi:SAM-dependent methyltransferase
MASIRQIIDSVMDQSRLEGVQEVWNTLARTDPLWAILSFPDKKGCKWDAEEFFREGRAEVDDVMGVLTATGYPVPNDKALDFGCGVGRLTQNLAGYFRSVVGVDISSDMLALARQFNRHGASVEYVHNSVDNLALFGNGTFDFLYARNVRGLTLNNVRFEVSGADLRPAVVFDHVEDAAVNGLSVEADPAAESVARFIDSRDVLLNAVRVIKPGPVFLRVEGAESNGIMIDGGDISKSGSPVSLGAGAAESSVKLRT